MISVNSYDLAKIVDSVLLENPIINSSLSELHIKQERELFRESILLQQQELHRTPSRFQIEAAWRRWQRERKLNLDAEKVDVTSIFIPRDKSNE
jgi:hypothetical protein